MPDLIVIIILGIVEGLTEFIPVSSTGHLLIAERLLVPQSDLFTVVIQSGAVLAVIPLFWPRCRQMLSGWRDAQGRDYLMKLMLAFVITGGPGYLLEKKGFKLDDSPVHIGLALLIGGILFLVVEWWLRGRQLRDEVTWMVAVAVGGGQLLAGIFPGTSRSGATIILSLLLGLSRPAATEFCFLVGIPTMLAAGGLKIFKALHHGAPAENWGAVAIGTLVAAAVSFIAVKWFLRYVRSHTFEGFGWYRIVVGTAVLLWMGR
ncbi:MAG TPA: undecaprenyl-diphosphate phosphatase [Candidatus Nitrosotalea sp.]|nr:undecaprenyl-diphosphate phosphatase [Candidatus Nitrosotalea sp.]